MCLIRGIEQEGEKGEGCIDEVSFCGEVLADCQNYEKILNDTFKDPEVYYVFPVNYTEVKNVLIYNLIFCYDGESKSCYRPFELFKRYADGINKAVHLKKRVNGSTGPVYDIYVVR